METEKETCLSCGGVLPPNWPTNFCSIKCAEQHRKNNAPVVEVDPGDRLRHQRMCLRKRPWPTETEAKLRAQKDETRYRKKFRVYKCPNCYSFHLTVEKE